MYVIPLPRSTLSKFYNLHMVEDVYYYIFYNLCMNIVYSCYRVKHMHRNFYPYLNNDVNPVKLW